MSPTGPFGVYVHVPFCRFRCDYCAFATYTDRDHLMGRYAEACVAEIERAGNDGSMSPATSVFFGGGTPSRLAADALTGILAAIPRRAGAEVTVECNPEDAAAGPAGRLPARRGDPASRFGVQSTAPHVLAGLGRHHGAEHVAAAAGAVGRAGFDSWNMDLIFGAAGETDADWERTLHEVLGLAPPAPAHQRLRTHRRARHPAGRGPGPAPRRRRRWPGGTSVRTRILAAAGYRWEEISNWARPGHGCRHNRLYWDQGDYRGIGSAAHSHRAGRRWWNVRTPDRYVDGRGGRSLADGRRGGARPRSSGSSSGWPFACGPRPASRRTPSRTIRASTAWSSGRGAGPSSPCGGDCWPTP